MFKFLQYIAPLWGFSLGFLPLLAAPLIAAAASTAGSVMAANSAKKNASRAAQANERQFEAGQEFNAEQAATARAFESEQALKQMEYQTASNAKQMDFQERMSSTAHQREMLDLRAAGLNPILSGTGGMGSTTPVGSSSAGSMARGHTASSPSGQATPVAQVFDLIGPAITTAMNASSVMAEITKKSAETTEIEARTPIHAEQVKQIQATTANVTEDTRYKTAMIGKTELETKRIRMEVEKVIEEIYDVYWRGLSHREDVFSKRSQRRITDVEANTMEGLQDKHLTQILKAHPLVSEFTDVIKSVIPRNIYHHKSK